VAVGAVAVSAYVRGLDAVLADRYQDYRAHLEALPLAAATRRAYAGRVGGYLAWLAELDPVTRRRRASRSPTATPGTTPSGTTAPTSSTPARPSPPRSTSPRPPWTPSTAGSASGRPASGATTCPRPPPEPSPWSRPAGCCGPRNAPPWPAPPVGCGTGPSSPCCCSPVCGIGELAALNRDDVAISARKGVVTVRRGKGERYRQVPLNAEARDTLHAWLDKRNALPGSDGPALFLSLKGQRLSARAIDLTVRRLAQQADLDASAHTLRHTCLTRLVRAGNDIVLVAELAGHARLETTRRYSLPSAADRQAAMDALTINY